MMVTLLQIMTHDYKYRKITQNDTLMFMKGHKNNAK